MGNAVKTRRDLCRAAELLLDSDGLSNTADSCRVAPNVKPPLLPARGAARTRSSSVLRAKRLTSSDDCNSD